MSKKSRRQFLKGVAVTGGGAALAGLAGTAQATPEAEAPQREQARRSRGYQVTAHVREYYEKARF